VEFPKTGKRGRSKKPRLIPYEDLKYAQFVKNKQGIKFQKVEKRVVFGQNIDQAKVSTSLLERQNLTFSRLTTGSQENNRFLKKD
jgi:hypothetical protein